MTTMATATAFPYPKALERFPRLRQSVLSQFDNCPLSTSFALRFERGWATHDQARGQLFHRIAAKCLEEMAEQGEERIETDVALSIMYEVLRQHDVDARDVVALPSRHVADLRMSVIKWAYDNTFDIAKLIDVEERLVSKVAYPNPLGGSVERELTGQLDALFAGASEEAIVVDWKDTWALPPEQGVSFGGYFQQRFYALLVMDAYPAIHRVTMREFYVRRSESREATVHREDLDDIRSEMSALAERFDRTFEGESWRPSPGKHCSFCASPGQCPIFPEARGAGAVTSDEEARRYAAEAVVARTVLERRQRALKAWADVHGGKVPVADAKGRRAFGYVEQVQVLRPDRETLERALSEAGGRPVDIDGLYRTRKGTRFVEHTPEEDEAPTPEDARLAEMLRRSLDERDK